MVWLWTLIIPSLFSVGFCLWRMQLLPKTHVILLPGWFLLMKDVFWLWALRVFDLYSRCSWSKGCICLLCYCIMPRKWDRAWPSLSYYNLFLTESLLGILWNCLSGLFILLVLGCIRVSKSIWSRYLKKNGISCKGESFHSRIGKEWVR